MELRLERDALGPIEVPADALWGAQTERARRNFPVSGVPLDRRLIHAMARIKQAAAHENAARGALPPVIARAIAESAGEVAEGLHDEHFVVDVFQTGSGTSSHMNVNEVVANLAIRRLGGIVGSRDPVHPNDHVNLGQSSNDVVPAAAHVAALAEIERDVLPGLDLLIASLERKAKAFEGVVKLGRTHLMDAVPMRLGDEIGAWAAQVRGARARLADTREGLAALALGGTAVGTGLNAPEGFAKAVIARLAEQTGLPLRQADDLFEALASRDALLAASSALRGVAIAMAKAANDVRWLASGPRSGLAELRIPDLQPGSSIMPGKVNPVMSEMVLMVCADVVGADASVAWAAASGNFELNVATPLIAQRVLESGSRVASAARLFAELCVDGIEADEARCRALAEASPALATPLARRLGYDVAASIAKEAAERRLTIREVCLERGVLPLQELDALLDLDAMASGSR